MKNILFATSIVLILLLLACQNTEKIPASLPKKQADTTKYNFVKLVVENVSKYPIVGSRFVTGYKDKFGQEREFTADSHRKTLPLQTDTLIIPLCNMACLAIHVYFLVGEDIIDCNRMLDLCYYSYPPKKGGIVLFSVDYSGTNSAGSTNADLSYDGCIVE